MRNTSVTSCCSTRTPVREGETGGHDPLVLREEPGFHVGARELAPGREIDGFQQRPAGVGDIDQVILQQAVLGGPADNGAELEVVRAPRLARDRPGFPPFKAR